MMVLPVHTPPGTFSVPALSMAPGGTVMGQGVAGRDVVGGVALLSAAKLAQTPVTGAPMSNSIP
jgi:hypothetical protein